MAISTYNIVLSWGTSAEAVSKDIDIKDFPDLLAAPEMLETTTLADSQVTQILGIKGSSSLTFTYNYTSADFAKVEADAGKDLYYELAFSDGSKFTWQGQHSSGMPGKGVNEVVEARVIIAASTPVEFTAAV